MSMLTTLLQGQVTIVCRTYRYQGGILEHIRLEVTPTACEVGIAREQHAVQQILEAQRAVAEGRQDGEGVGAAADE